MSIENVVKLARIELSSDELATYERQLGVIIDYVAKLNDINLDDINLDIENNNVFRDDIVRPSLSQLEVFKNAPDHNNNFFIVPKVID